LKKLGRKIKHNFLLDLQMGIKVCLAVVTLLTDFLFTGWLLNWAPMDVMLTYEGYYSEFCTTEIISATSKAEHSFIYCDDQQVRISSLWSAVLLSEFTILPNGILMDYLGPAFFSGLLFVIHVASLIATIYIPKNSSVLLVTFFLMGAAVQACSLVAMRTVYIFESARARKRWIVACCTIFDSSAIVTMIFYNIWDVNLIHLYDMFWILTVLGGVLYGAQCVLWVGLNRLTAKPGNVVTVSEENPLLEKPLNCLPGNQEDVELGVHDISLFDIFCSSKFYLFTFLCAVNIYRIRYFLGISNYTLIYLNDNGTYLQLLGYCFALSIVFAPVVDRILALIESRSKALHIVNVSVALFFITWMIPNLPIQVVTFALFILARLFTFSVLFEYCSEEFTEQRFGLVMGAGFVAAAIPGAFMYKIVQIVLARYNDNFWAFHLMCIAMSIPTGIVIWVLGRSSEAKPIKESGTILATRDSFNVSSTPRRNFTS